MTQPLTLNQAIIISAYTGYLICPMTDMQAAIEKKLGRQVWSHELGNERLQKQIKATFKDDFLALKPKEVP